VVFFILKRSERMNAGIHSSEQAQRSGTILKRSERMNAGIHSSEQAQRSKAESFY
jgi:hypothetical protein